MAAQAVSEAVLLDRRDGWARLTLNRPERLNAFNQQLHEALRAALDTVKREGLRAVVLTGAGRAFSAGQDLADPAFPTDEDANIGPILERWYNPLVLQLRALPMPVVAAVTGIAAGAGANLALACDVVVAGRNARFIQAFARLGLVPDAGGSWTLVHKLGEARAMGLALTGEPLSGEAAAEWGLIWRAVDDGDVLSVAEDLAARFARGPTRGYALTKRAIHAAAGNDLAQQLALEAELQQAAGRTVDYAEGVRAFLAKREPEFGGY